MDDDNSIFKKNFKNSKEFFLNLKHVVNVLGSDHPHRRKLYLYLKKVLKTIDLNLYFSKKNSIMLFAKELFLEITDDIILNLVYQSFLNKKNNPYPSLKGVEGFQTLIKRLGDKDQIAKATDQSIGMVEYFGMSDISDIEGVFDFIFQYYLQNVLQLCDGIIEFRDTMPITRRNFSLSRLDIIEAILKWLRLVYPNKRFKDIRKLSEIYLYTFEVFFSKFSTIQVSTVKGSKFRFLSPEVGENNMSSFFYDLHKSQNTSSIPQGSMNNYRVMVIPPLP